MSIYRVSKRKKMQHEPIESEDFDNLNIAYDYAIKSSLIDIKHFFTVEEKTDDEEYKILKIFQNGIKTIEFL